MSSSSDKSTVFPLDRVRMLVAVAYERVCSSSVVDEFNDERSMLKVFPASTMVKVSVEVANEALVINSLVDEASASSIRVERSTVVDDPSSISMVKMFDPSSVAPVRFWSSVVPGIVEVETAVTSPSSLTVTVTAVVEAP